MLVVEVLVAVVVLIGAAVLATGRADVMAPGGPDLPDPGLPGDRPIRSGDLAGLRFRIALRGYRMEDVDRALDVVAVTLAGYESAAGTDPDDRTPDEAVPQPASAPTRAEPTPEAAPDGPGESAVPDPGRPPAI